NLYLYFCPMVKISVVIITYNEEKNIARCIDSVTSVADEIVVIDSYSKDRTKELCLAKGVLFFEHAFRNHIDQKNYAVTKASHQYILSLDADEYLSPELIKSLLEVKKTWPCDAYRMNRLSSYGTRWIKHGSWYPDRKIRLWNRDVGVWGGENPHDRVVLRKGTPVIHLEGDILHRAYKDSRETLEKVQRYSDIFASENVGRKKSSILKILGHTTFAFIKSYIIKRGFLDGYEGLMVAKAEGNHVFYKYAKLYEANKRAALGKRIVISRTDNLGDVILTLPLLGYLKATMPETRIFFIGKKYTSSVIDKCIHVDKLLDREEVLKDPNLLRGLHADTILFIYPDRELASLSKRLNIPRRVATAHRLFNWFYCNYLVDFSRIRSRLHESQLNFKLLSPFKIYWDFDLKEIADYYGLVPPLQSHNGTIKPDRFNLILHPKSKGSAREWQLNNYYELAKALPQDRYHVYVTGLKEEGDMMRREKPELFSLPHVTDMTGKLSLDELMSFISQIDGLLSCSTGVLHLASALGKYTIGLYSPMKPIHPGRWMPLGRHAEYMVIDKNCSNCRRMKECACVNEITVSQVRERIERFSNQVNAPRSIAGY
ncbi:MAG TPA: glycosyltransferase family 9 protein, partial [Cyclobacteriaceae bacterium]|nr:glycosyltransferase family 9 protein [Cyclobacteriaceae bacterium]